MRGAECAKAQSVTRMVVASGDWLGDCVWREKMPDGILEDWRRKIIE